MSADNGHSHNGTDVAENFTTTISKKNIHSGHAHMIKMYQPRVKIPHHIS
jgi:hypothetical protein